MLYTQHNVSKSNRSYITGRVRSFSLLSQCRCCSCIPQSTLHLLMQVPGIGTVANSRPLSHDRAIRSRLVTTRENLIARAGPTDQSYSVANPNGSETRRHSTEPVPVGRLPRTTVTAEKEQPSPQGRRAVRIAALFTPATDGACQSAARIWRLPAVFIRHNR